MKTTLLLVIFLGYGFIGSAQTGWTVCNSPVFVGRVDDIFMVNTTTGYAVAGDGQIVKTIDGGENWTTVESTASARPRSVEFINEQTGFVGSFPVSGFNPVNVLRKTTNGGADWTDITSSLPVKARAGICGLSIPDPHTIYGGGNWYQDSGYVVKSTDGGNTWSLIDMTSMATSIIDLYFLSRDTGFVTGKGPEHAEAPVILYTTDGGTSWTKVYQGTHNGYCWKIQRLTSRIYYASNDHTLNTNAEILRSVDGGMNWVRVPVTSQEYHIQGVGFIDPLAGWAGGDLNKSFETKDGGKTWDSIPVCPAMNRVLRLNDSTIFATGRQIWKYKGSGIYPAIADAAFASMKCYPNPVKDIMSINVALAVPTRLYIGMYDASGHRIKVIDNTDRLKGSYVFEVSTSALPAGVYHVLLKTHLDKLVKQILVVR